MLVFRRDIDYFETCFGASKMSDWDSYRQLQKDEIIRKDDEVLVDDTIGWQPVVHTIGKPAPDPSFIAHRMYRRKTEGRA